MKMNCQKSGLVRFGPLLLCLLCLAEPFHACAHALLDHAEPAVGSKISSAPDQVKIWFTQDLEPAFSSIRVEDSRGKQVDKKDSHVDDHRKSRLLVSLPKLPAGTYVVTWRAVSVDTHKTQGHFEFTIK